MCKPEVINQRKVDKRKCKEENHSDRKCDKHRGKNYGQECENCGVASCIAK